MLLRMLLITPMVIFPLKDFESEKRTYVGTLTGPLRVSSIISMNSRSSFLAWFLSSSCSSSSSPASSSFLLQPASSRADVGVSMTSSFLLGYLRAYFALSRALATRLTWTEGSRHSGSSVANCRSGKNGRGREKSLVMDRGLPPSFFQTHLPQYDSQVHEGHPSSKTHRVARSIGKDRLGWNRPLDVRGCGLCECPVPKRQRKISFPPDPFFSGGDRAAQ